jgi:hypothetical protein
LQGRIVGSAGADPDDGIDLVLGVQFVRINANGRTTHATCPYAYLLALVGACVKKAVTGFTDQLRRREKCRSNVFCPQGIARQ